MSAPVLLVPERSRHRPALGLRQMDALRTTYAPRREVSLRLTLGPLAQGRTDPTMQRDATGIWLALATDAGSASLHLRSDRRRASRRRRGATGAEAAIEQVPALCGADDDDERLRRDAAPADRRAAPPHAGAAADARRPHPAVPGADHPRAEGHRHRAEARLARSSSRGTASRRPGPRRSACASRRRPRSGAASRRGSGTAPASARSAPTPSCARSRSATRSSGRAGWMRRRRSVACARSPASGSGRRTRPCSARTATPTP